MDQLWVMKNELAWEGQFVVNTQPIWDDTETAVTEDLRDFMQWYLCQQGRGQRTCICCYQCSRNRSWHASFLIDPTQAEETTWLRSDTWHQRHKSARWLSHETNRNRTVWWSRDSFLCRFPYLWTGLLRKILSVVVMWTVSCKGGRRKFQYKTVRIAYTNQSTE